MSMRAGLSPVAVARCGEPRSGRRCPRLSCRSITFRLLAQRPARSMDARLKPAHDEMEERYLFSNFGGRLAMKAAMPSFWSAVANSE